MAESDFSPPAILSGLGTTFVGRIVMYHPHLPSTMDVARQAASEGVAEGAIVLTEEQTAGRGRLGRSWLSPRGSIALSVILRPTLAELAGLNMVAPLAVARCIERVTALKTAIKWPNDVLIRGRKVCGVLLENSVRGDVVDWAIIGIGLNVNLEVSSLPEIADIATSLSAELGRELPRQQLLCSLLEELEWLYLGLKRGEPLHLEWRERLETLGKQVSVSSGEVIREGVAVGVARDGSLLLRRHDGSVETIVAGEVTLRG